MNTVKRRRRSLATVAVFGIATLAASIAGGNAFAGIEGIALLGLFFGGAEIARRRGSSIGAVMSGERDERIGQLQERAAARTAVIGYLGLVGWIVYGTAMDRNTDAPGIAVVVFALVFYANVAWITWSTRIGGHRAAGAAR